MNNLDNQSSNLDDEPNTIDLSASTILDLDGTNEDNFLNYSKVNNDDDDDEEATAAAADNNNPSFIIPTSSFHRQKSTLDSPATISVDNFSSSFQQNSHHSAAATSTSTTRTKNIYYSCAHCQYRFVYNDLDNFLIVCPECKLVSSISDDFKNTNGILYLFFFSVLLLMADNFVRIMISRDSSTFLFYLLKSIFYMGSVICLWRSIHFFTIKVSPLSLK